MASDKSGAPLRSIYTLFTAGTVSGLADGELLQRFAAGDGEAAELAFTAIVERHGPMVMRVCRGVLRDVHDAEDAFQATFLILARKAGTIRGRDSLATWLHRVAFNVAATARSAAARRRLHELEAGGTRPQTMAEGAWDDIGPVVHEELNRLPGRYRAAVVLCYLEGLTQQQAALHLGWPLGTVQSRLARGRERLRVQLIRRGQHPSAWLPGAVLTTGTAPPALPTVLMDSMAHAATQYAAGKMAAGVLPASVATLTEGVLGTMLMTKLGKFAAIALLAGFMAGGVGLLAHELGQVEPQVPRSTPDAASSPGTKHDATKKETDDLRRRQAELVEEIRSLKEELRKSKVAQSTPFRTMGGLGAGEPPPPVHTLPASTSAEIIAVHSPGQERIWAQSVDGGAWKLYRVPKGVTVAPNLASNVLALEMEGPEVAQVATFESVSGEWHPHDLRESAKGHVHPLVGQNLAVYTVGRFVYAFSAPAKRWDVLELAEGAKPSPRLAPTYIMVEEGSHLHIFSARTGRWSDLDTKAENQ